jgi:hypothetical protein
MFSYAGWIAIPRLHASIKRLAGADYKVRPTPGKMDNSEGSYRLDE